MRPGQSGCIRFFFHGRRMRMMRDVMGLGLPRKRWRCTALDRREGEPCRAVKRSACHLGCVGGWSNMILLSMFYNI